MADRIKQIPQKLLEIWKNWSVKQRIIIVSSIVAFIAVVGILAFVLTRPKYQVLVTCDDYTEMNSVTSLLSENNHKYKIDNMVVSVNEKELTACKMLLAREALQLQIQTAPSNMHIILKLSLQVILKIWMVLRVHRLLLICLKRLIPFIRLHQMLRLL